MNDIATVVKTLVENAEALRKAGVQGLKVGDVEVALVPWSERTVPAPTAQEIALSVEDDPATYGYKGVPTYGRPPRV